MKDLKKVKEIIKKICKNPRGKAFLFFGVYFFFFLFLIIAIRNSNVTSDNTYEEEKEDYKTITWLDNYKYDYKIIIDSNNYSYSGIRSDEINVITSGGKDYYCNDEICYIKKEEDLEEVANPCFYSEVLNLSNFKNLLKLATKDSTTNYEDGRVGYNYLLSTTTIVKNIDKKDIDLDDLPNTISIIYKDNIEERLEIDLTSYGKYKGLCNNSFKIVVEFKDQGNIDLDDIS